MTPPARVVDLNADLGESFAVWRLGDDEAMLAIGLAAQFRPGQQVRFAVRGGQLTSSR